ncbi:MAG: DMT family transporter [Gemmatimonadetes bacterium]|nr:DMT family transporter [Gemmatimonadota bacterium]
MGPQEYLGAGLPFPAGLPRGETAALGAALIWAFTSLFFARAGRLISPIGANTFKCAAAAVLLTLAHFLIERTPFPSAALSDWLILLASGVIGLAIGDSFLFSSFIRIGPRKGLLLLSLNPLIGTALGWILFREALDARSLAGIAVTMTGVLVVLSPKGGFRSFGAASVGERALLYGVLFGIGAACCQATGALVAKPALARIDNLTATQIRMYGGTAALVLLGLARGRFGHWANLIRVHRLFRPLFVASFLGQFVAVWLMTVSIDYAPAGIALTILSTAPIWLIPLGGRFQDHAPTPGETTGLLVAIAGIAVLLIR